MIPRWFRRRRRTELPPVGTLEEFCRLAGIEPDDWTTQWDAEHTFPFVEDQHCNITGLGHQDRSEFARLINAYDELANGEPFPEHDQWTADDITHHYAVRGQDGETLCARIDGERVTDRTPFAVPITTLWGHR